MVSYRTLASGVLAAWLTFGASMPACALAPLEGQAYYRLDWSGMPLGRIRIESEEDDTSYRMVVDTKSKGVVNIFTPFRTVATVSGARADGDYLPRTYRTRSERNDECNDCGTTLEYNETGRLTDRLLVPPNNDPSWRPIVPLEQAAEATDPISGYFQLRTRLRRNTDQGMKDTTIRLYDGKRLLDISAHLLERSAASEKKHRPATLLVALRRTPIAGYTKKERTKFEKGDPVVYAEFSDDDAMQLRHVYFDLTLGRIHMTLRDE